MSTIDLTNELIDQYQFSEAYVNWLCDNGHNYDVVICNGDTLLDAQENLVGFEDFLNYLQGQETAERLRRKHEWKQTGVQSW